MVFSALALGITLGTTIVSTAEAQQRKAQPQPQAQQPQAEQQQVRRGQPITAQRWSMVQDKSTIFYTNPSVGRGNIPVNNFDVQLNFDPSKLDNSRLVIRADVSSMFLPSDAVNIELFQYLPKTTQVSGESPAAATFMSSAIKRRSSNEFVAEGGLRVGGKSRAVAIPFTVTLDRNVPGGMMIILRGGFTANRIDFATESYAKSGPAQVPVSFEIAAVPMR